MAGQLQSNFQEALKIFYGDRVHSLTNDRAKIHNMIPEVQRPFDGKYLQEAVTARYPASYGAYGPQLASLPTPDFAQVNNSIVRHCYYYATAAWDWDIEALSGSNIGAFAKAKALQMERLSMGMLQDLERIAVHDGSGVLADSITVITAATGDDWTFDVTVQEGVRFPIGQRVWFNTTVTSDRKANLKSTTQYSVPTQNFYTVKNNVPRGGATTAKTRITIEEASPAGNPPVTGAVAIKAFSMAYANTGSGTNSGNEPMGLLGIIDNDGPPLVTNSKSGFDTDGTFQSLSPTTFGAWRSPTVAGSGNEYLSPTLLEQLSEDMTNHSKAEMEEAAFILTTPFQARKYREILLAAERYPVTTESPSLPTGTTSSTQTTKRYLTFAGIPIIPTRYLDAGIALVVNTNEIKRASLRPFSFKAEHQDFGGAPRTQQDGMSIFQTFTHDRSSSGRLESLKTT